MDKITKVFGALSEKNRIRILLLLTKKRLCVCEIQEILGISVSTVSKHLSILKDVGFIADEKEGKWIYYSIDNSLKDLLLSQMLLLLPIYLNDNELAQSDFEKVKTISKKDKCSI